MPTKTTVAATIDFDAVTKNLKSVFKELYVPVTQETWKNWSLEDQLRLRQTMATLFGIGTKGKKSFAVCFRGPYDQTIWNGHEDGSVDLKVESIRAQRKPDAETPGKKAVVKTADDIFAELG